MTPDQEVIEFFNGFYFVLFVIGVALIAIRMLARLIRYLSQGGLGNVPELLWPSFLFYTSLGIIFGGIFIGRLLNLELVKNPWWVITTGALANVALYIGVWYEYFRIGRHE